MPWIITRCWVSDFVSSSASIKSDTAWKSRSRSRCGWPTSENGRNGVCTTGKSGRWIRYGTHRNPLSPVQSSISLRLTDQKVSNLSFTTPLHSCLCSFFCMELITYYQKNNKQIRVRFGLTICLWPWAKGLHSCSENWFQVRRHRSVVQLSLIHIWRCRRSTLCRSRWSPYH